MLRNVDQLFIAIHLGYQNSGDYITMCKFCTFSYSKCKPPFLFTARAEASEWSEKISFVKDGWNFSNWFKGWRPGSNRLVKKIDFTYTVLAHDDDVGKKKPDCSYTGIHLSCLITFL